MAKFAPTLSCQDSSRQVFSGLTSTFVDLDGNQNDSIDADLAPWHAQNNHFVGFWSPTLLVTNL